MDTELSYFAGFFDADGSVGIRRTKNAYGTTIYQMWVVVYNSNQVVLEKFQNRFKGSISISHDYPERGWKTGYRWNLSSILAKDFLEKILCYLVVKKERAEIAIEFQSLKKQGGRTILERDSLGHMTKVIVSKQPNFDEHYQKLKQLNRRGIEVLNKEINN